MTTTHTGLPVAGYQAQSQDRVDMVNANKETEERILRLIDGLQETKQGDPRWLAIARTDMEKAWMSLNRAIFQPQRVVLSTDPAPDIAA